MFGPDRNGRISAILLVLDAENCVEKHIITYLNRFSAETFTKNLIVIMNRADGDMAESQENFCKIFRILQRSISGLSEDFFPGIDAHLLSEEFSRTFGKINNIIANIWV